MIVNLARRTTCLQLLSLLDVLGNVVDHLPMVIWHGHDAVCLYLRRTDVTGILFFFHVLAIVIRAIQDDSILVRLMGKHGEKWLGVLLQQLFYFFVEVGHFFD